MSDKLHTLEVGSLLAKNPKAAGVFQDNRKKLAKGQMPGRRPRVQKQYALGLPYERSLATTTAPIPPVKASHKAKSN